MKKSVSSLLCLFILFSLTVSLTCRVSASEGPCFEISNVNAEKGKDAEIDIMIVNNPGIASVKLKVSFDEDLELYSIRYNEDIGGDFQLPQKLTSPVTLNWFNGKENTTGDFVFATLSFKVTQTAEEGVHNLSVSYDEEDLYNIEENNVPFAVIGGRVRVLDFYYGDANGDGEVTALDVIRLKKYFSKFDKETNMSSVSVAPGADVNGDKALDSLDVVRLKRFFAEYDHTDHSSSVRLGPEQ